MPECRYTLLKSGRAELEEKKSRFLAQSFFVRSEAEVAEILLPSGKNTTTPGMSARPMCSLAIRRLKNPPTTANPQRPRGSRC